MNEEQKFRLFVRAVIVTWVVAWVIMVTILCNKAQGAETNLLPENALMRDRYGNVTGSFRKMSNSKTGIQFDKYGNAQRTYRQIGNTVYIYDKYGNLVGTWSK